MAPGTLPVPQLIFPPSKAGPAAVEVTRIPSRFPRAISPLVPRSSSRDMPGLSSMPQCISPAAISLPT